MHVYDNVPECPPYNVVEMYDYYEMYLYVQKLIYLYTAELFSYNFSCNQNTTQWRIQTFIVLQHIST